MAVQRRKDKVTGRVLPPNVSRRADGRYIHRSMVYGKPHYIYDRDLDKLKEKILEFEYSLKNGKVLDISKLSLDEWYPQYIELYKKGKVKDTTLKNQISYYTWYIKDSIVGRIDIKSLRRSIIVAHFKELTEKKHLAQSTLKNLAGYLYNACQQALYDGVINLNPCIDIMKDITATPKEIRDALTVEETKLMLEYMKIEDNWANVYLPIIGIGLGTGMRWGELSGLTWGDIDMSNKIISVNHSIHYRDRGQGKHEFFITSPKTVNAVRRIPMSDEVYELFKKQKKYQKQMRIRDDIAIDGYKDFVFTAKTGIPYTHESIVRATKLIVKRANEWEAERAVQENRKPVVIRSHTPHIWRHSFTTRLVEKEVPYETLKLLLGHSSIKTSMDIYSHIKQQNYKRLITDVSGILDIL